MTFDTSSLSSRNPFDNALSKFGLYLSLFRLSLLFSGISVLSLDP